MQKSSPLQELHIKLGGGLGGSLVVLIEGLVGRSDSSDEVGVSGEGFFSKYGSSDEGGALVVAKLDDKIDD